MAQGLLLQPPKAPWVCPAELCIQPPLLGRASSSWDATQRAACESFPLDRIRNVPARSKYSHDCFPEKKKKKKAALICVVTDLALVSHVPIMIHFLFLSSPNHCGKKNLVYGDSGISISYYLNVYRSTDA